MIHAPLLEGWDLNWPFSPVRDSLLCQQSYIGSTVWTSRTNTNFSVEPKSPFERHPNLWRGTLKHLEVGRSSSSLNPPQQTARFQLTAWTVEKVWSQVTRFQYSQKHFRFNYIEAVGSRLDVVRTWPAFLANLQVKRDKGKLVTFTRGTSISTFHR